MLLDRAHAVSKTWNDAPVILCGDFYCTPKVTSSSEFLKKSRSGVFGLLCHVNL